MSIDKIKACLIRNGIPFSKDLPGKLYTYFNLLKEWNSRMDLTAVTDDEEMLDKHFIDSLTVLKTGILSETGKMIDIGTGAGFPGMVLAMACPKLSVTLLDAQQKRLAFLEHVARETDTRNTGMIHARAEDGARKPEMREQFDFAVARALAPTNILCEYLLPYVKIGGCALCWKGPALTEEIDNGRKVAHLLGGSLEMPLSCHVEGRDWEHMILPIQKISHTASAYPRKAGTPKNKPLGI